MKKVNTSFGKFAKEWDQDVGEIGNFTHTQMVNQPLFKLIGSVKGKRVYDIACGNGFLSRMLVRKGALKVVASDVSPELIQIAKLKYSDKGIEYEVHDAKEFKNFSKNFFDVVILNLAAYYIKDIDLFFKGVKKILKSGGVFVFVLPHPLVNVVERLVDPKVRKLQSDKDYLKESVVSWYRNGDKKNGKNVYYHRPLQVYFNKLIKHGLIIKEVIEPQAKVRFGKSVKTLNIPKYILIKVQKV